MNRKEKIAKQFLDFFTCSDEDLAREVSEEQLKLLCTKVNCTVLMDRWNPVVDIQRQLLSQGRSQENKSVRSANRFIAKVFNHYRPYYTYKDEQILELKEKEYRDRKKLNLLRLELWEYNQKMADNAHAKNDNQQLSPQLSQDLGDRNESNSVQRTSTEQFAQFESAEQIVAGVVTLDSPERNPSQDLGDGKEKKSEQRTCNGTSTEQFSQFESYEQLVAAYITLDSSENNVNNLAGAKKTHENEAYADFLAIGTESMLIQSQLTENFGTESMLNRSSPESIIFTQGTEYSEFNRSVPCTSTQDHLCS